MALTTEEQEMLAFGKRQLQLVPACKDFPIYYIAPTEEEVQRAFAYISRYLTVDDIGYEADEAIVKVVLDYYRRHGGLP